jgi:hypothetical protein
MVVVCVRFASSERAVCSQVSCQVIGMIVGHWPNLNEAKRSETNANRNHLNLLKKLAKTPKTWDPLLLGPYLVL